MHYFNILTLYSDDTRPDDDVVTGLSVVVVDGGVVEGDVVVEVVGADVVDGEGFPVVDGADPSSLHHIQQ